MSRVSSFSSRLIVGTGSGAEEVEEDMVYVEDIGMVY